MPAGGKQIVRVRIAQPGPPRLLSRLIQVRSLQCDHGSIELPEIATSAGRHDAQLDRLINPELTGLRTPRDLQGMLWPPQRSLAVGQHGQTPGITTQAAGSAQFPQCLRPFPGDISRESRSFPHGRDPTRLASREAGMRQSQLRVIVEYARCHDEMASHQIGQAFG